MPEPFRILIIEDDPEHAELIKMGFRRHDEFFLNFAASGEDGLEMISSKAYDLISIDLVLPGMGGLDVLVRIRKLDPDIPVVMVSGHGTTEMAVVAFENRATKYVVKSLESFKSLPYVFENLIQEARFKSNERAMRSQIERSERIHRSIVENALAGIYILQDGAFRLVNPKLGEIFGTSAESLLGLPFWQMIKPDDMACVSRLESDPLSDIPVYESKVQRKDGTSRWIEFRTVAIEYEGKRAILGNVLDITARKDKEIDMMNESRELSALEGLTEICLSGMDLDGRLGGVLCQMVSGTSGAEVGGIFLQEEEGLELRALHGSVEELIRFIRGVETVRLLSQPLVHPTQIAGRNWISVPIVGQGETKGLAVLALLQEADRASLKFLEKAAGRLGRLLDALSPEEMLPSTQELLSRIKAGFIQD
ncbi:MAG: response regulator domain with PAS sensor [Methanosaeta sp. NSM2]|nr:PAS domain S-box protein [Methanothrix sp.]OYV13510.1 MAG: response regulator domain with PAS sensor [Methanosaeta sp. NSM2]